MWKLLRRKRSFRALVGTQFLGAFNDNAFKELVALAIISTSTSIPWIKDHFLAREGGMGLVGTLFALPFVVLGPLTGSLADRVSKTRIIKAANLMEVFVMGSALAAFFFESYPLLLMCVLLMGTQSAIFGPSKYGVIPELIEDRDMSRGNALIQMTTFIAIIFGMIVAGEMLTLFSDRLWIPGCFYVGFALIGWQVSLRIGDRPAQNPDRPVNWNPVAEIRHHWGAVAQNKPLVLSIWASAFFYLVTATLIYVVNFYGDEVLGMKPDAISRAKAFIAIGIVAGSVLAGKISGDRIETGLVPLGLGGISCSLLAIVLGPTSAVVFCVALFFLGISAGLFSIPIRVLLQKTPAKEKRGSVLGLSETFDFTGILLASMVYFLFEKVLELSPTAMFTILSVAVVVFLASSLFYTAQFAVRLGLLFLVRCFYRVRVEGEERVPSEGGALLVCNHVSFVDGMLVAASLAREPRFLMYTPFFDVPVLGWFAKRMGVIPVSGGDSEEEKTASLKAAADAAAGGDLVCIFAEGGITRSGAMLGFARGLERIAGQAGVPIVPVALDRLWGSLFSFEGGKVFFKRPQRIPYPVDMLIGEPMPHDSAAWEVRNAVAERLAIHRSTRRGPWGHLGRRLLLSAKQGGRGAALVMDTGTWSHRRLLTEALAVRERLEGVLPQGERIGFALPLGLDAVTISLALCLSERVPVLLDAGADPGENAERLKRSGAVAVIAGAELGAALDLPVITPGLIAPTRAGRWRAWLLTWLPTVLIARLLGLSEDSSRCAAIHFERGLDGADLMIPLSHSNILSNVQGLAAMVDLSAGDRVLATLPLHGAFGRTTTLFAPLLSGATIALAPGRRDAEAVAEFVEGVGVTHLVGTASQARACLVGVAAERFKGLKLAFVGGEEAVGQELVEAWSERFGSALLTGHGRTECGPVISLNVPDIELMGSREEGARVGTVGRALPGTALRVVDPKSGAALPPGTAGVLEVKGPGVASGYLDDEERSVSCFREGWFSTGERAVIDKHGFCQDLPRELEA